MNIDEFRAAVTEPLKAVLPTFNGMRVATAYRDLLGINNLASEIESSIAGKDLFEAANSGDTQLARYIMERQQQLLTLLKALYMFADIFVNVSLREVLGLHTVTLNSFVRKPRSPLVSLPPEAIRPVYTVVIYRHKIIVHHDVPRMDGSISGGSGEYRLVPFAMDFHISSEDAVTLNRLTAIYGSSVPGLLNEVNSFQQLFLLFHNLSIGALGNISSDREAIDKIAERGGCKSHSRTEVLSAIDEFALALVNGLGNAQTECSAST